MEQMLFLVPVVGLLGLLFAVILRQQVVKEDPGTDKMREIADAIAEGANAFLASEYRILVVFVAVLFFVIGFGTRNWITAGCFLVGSGFSTMAGYLGMNAAIRANSRTANAARSRLRPAGRRRSLHIYKRRIRFIRLQPGRFFHRTFCPCGRRHLHQSS